MRARARHTHTRTPRIHARERERGCGVSPVSIYFLIAAKLSWPSWQVPSFSLEEQGEGGGPTDSRVEDRWRDGGRGGGRPYITAHEKRPSTGRLISEALPPPPFKANPRPGHESRHSTAPFHPPPSLFHLTRMKSVIFLLSISFDTEKKKKNPRRQRRVAAIFETWNSIICRDS